MVKVLYKTGIIITIKFKKKYQPFILRQYDRN